MIHHKAICPKCNATVACRGPRVTISSHYVHGALCPGSHMALKPDVPEDIHEVAPLDFRERYGTLTEYAATCRPLWVAINEDDRKGEDSAS